MEQAFPYQITGSEWLAKKYWALLADEMGLGKSRQVVMACDRIGAVNILIICPAVARINWQREFTFWSLVERTFKLCFGKEDLPETLTICSYDYVSDHTERLKKIKWDVIVVDEAHFAKSVNAQRTKAILGKAGVIHKSKRMWTVSGTPAPNNNSELWPILYTFGVTTLKYIDFVKRYCLWVQDSRPGRNITISGNNPVMDAEMRKMLSKIMLRRLKEDVMKDLPPIFYSDLFVEPGEVDLEVHSGFFEYVFPADRRQELQSILDADLKIVTDTFNRTKLSVDGIKMLEGMAKSVSTLRRYNGLQKVNPVVAIVDEELKAKKYDKIVLFAVHRDVIESLRAQLSHHGAVTLYGGTDPKSRQKHVDRFMTNPKCRVFVGNIQAAGTAITLTSSCQVMFVEQEWTPGHNAQAAMRCHRIGQQRTVFVRFVGIANSIDEHISRKLKQKTRELTAIFDKKDEVNESDLIPVTKPREYKV